MIDVDGLPVAGASVVLGAYSAQADSFGRFELEVGYLGADERLVAMHTGLRPAVVDGFGESFKAHPDAHRELVLQLGSATSSIAGRVVDADGKGLADIEVWLVDALAYGNTSFTVESMLSGEWSDHVTTGVDGHFELDGLFRESYRVLAIGTAEFLAASKDDVPTGTRDLRLVLDPALRLERVAGRVVDRNGRAVAGATLSATVALAESEHSSTTRSYELGVTNEHGEFELLDVPCAGGLFTISGSGVESVELMLENESMTDFVITVSLLLRFQLDPDVCPQADAFELVDEGGERLRFIAFSPGVTSHRNRSSLRNREALPTFQVSDLATEIVFYAGETVVQRSALHLVRGEVVRVR